MKLSTFILCRLGRLNHEIYSGRSPSSKRIRRAEARSLRDLRGRLGAYAANYRIGNTMGLPTAFPVATLLEWHRRAANSSGQRRVTAAQEVLGLLPQPLSLNSHP